MRFLLPAGNFVYDRVFVRTPAEWRDWAASSRMRNFDMIASKWAMAHDVAGTWHADGTLTVYHRHGAKVTRFKVKVPRMVESSDTQHDPLRYLLGLCQLWEDMYGPAPEAVPWVAPPGRVALVMGANCWGKGANALEALRNCKRHAPAQAKTFVLYNVPTEFVVSEVDGSISYSKRDGAPRRLGAVNARGVVK